MRLSFPKIIGLAALCVLVALAVFLQPASSPPAPPSSLPVAKPKAPPAGTAIAHSQISKHAVTALEPEEDLPYTTLEEFQKALDAALKSKAPASVLSRLINQSHKKLKPVEQSQFMVQAITGLATKEALKTAGDVMRALKDLHDQQTFATGIASALADHDPKTASEWASSLAGHDMARNAHQVVGREWARTDLAAATEWINQTRNPVLKNAIAEGIAQSWAGQDMEGLTKWAESIPDQYVQSAVLVKAVKVMAATDPAGSAEWAAKFPEGPGRTQAIAFSATAWGAADSASAAAWAQEFTDPATRINALTGVMRGWITTNQPAAEAWANQLPASERDQVLAAVKGQLR